MKGNVDCAPHMFITTPLPKFIDPPVKEHRCIATRKSTWPEPYEEVNERANTKSRASLTVSANRRTPGSFCPNIGFFIFGGAPILGLP
jgi:hypothetical protein